MEDLQNKNTENFEQESHDSVEPENVEYVETTYTREMARGEFRRSFLPFTIKGKTHLYGDIAFFLAALFFAIPGIISIMSFIFPKEDVLNYIATQTGSFFSAASIIVGIACAWLLIGRMVECVADKKRFLPYENFGDILKKNIVRILLFIVILLLTISSLVNAGNTKNAFTNQTDGVFTWYFVAAGALLISLVKNKKQQRILLVLFSSAAVLTCFVMFRQYVIYYKNIPIESFSDFIKIWSMDFSQIETSAQNLRQLRGIFANSNHYGYFLTLSSLAAAGLYITGDKLWKRILSAVGFVIFMFTMVLNDTLGAQLAIILVVILLPVAFIKSKMPIYRRFVPLVLMLCVMVFMSAFPQLPIGSMVIRNSIDELKEDFKAIMSYESKSEEEVALQSHTEQDQLTNRTSGRTFALLGRTTITTPANDSSDITGEEQSRSDIIAGGMVHGSVTSETPEESSLSESSGESDTGLSEEADNPANSIETPEISAETIEEAKSDTRWWLKHQELGTSRLGLWQYGIHLMAQKPLLGYGVNGSKSLFQNESGLANPATRVHNEYLQIGIDGGIPAMLIHLAAYIMVVIYFFRAMKRGTLTDFQRILFTMFAAYAVSAFMGICAYYTASYFYIWLGLLLSTFEGSFHEYPVAEKPDDSELVADGTDV